MQDVMQVLCLIKHQKVSNASLQHLLHNQIHFSRANNLQINKQEEYAQLLP